MFRATHQVHQPTSPRDERALSPGHRRAHRLGGLRLHGRAGRRDERGRDAGRGAAPLLTLQAVADLLSSVKMQAEACRALTWGAAHALQHGPGSYEARRELALAAKVYCSEAAVRAVGDAVNLVGMYE